MTCVFDENLPPKLAKALNILEGKTGIDVFHIRDRFPPKTTDIEWISSLSKIKDCFVITKDRSIKKNLHEYLAWKESNLKIVFLQKSWKNQKLWDIAWKFVKRWNEVKAKIEKADSIMLPITGKIEVLSDIF